ncbi:MAG: hypothetical protein AB8F74_03535 [Saprospiraceae bacterium]
MKNLNYFFVLLLALLNSNIVTAQYSISGNITCLGGGIVSEQEVVLTGNNISDMTVLTDIDGNYSFTNLPTDSDYTLSVEKDEEILNGVSTYDLVLMAKHILNLQPFTTPFHLLAADVNSSGTVTTLDLVLIRQVILNQVTTYPNGQSFLFATSDYDPANGTGAVGTVIISDLQEDHTVDFVQVKLGDMNGSTTCQ